MHSNIPKSVIVYRHRKLGGHEYSYPVVLLFPESFGGMDMAVSCAACANGTPLCLHKVNLFQNLDTFQIQAVRSLIRQQTFTNGEVVLHEGTRSDRLVIVRFGAIKLVRYGSDGKEYVLDTLFPGDFYGGDQIFSSGVLQETAIAEGECGICTITGKHLQDLMLATPEIALKMITYLNAKVEQYRFQVEMLSTKDVEKRICMYLLDRIQRTDSNLIPLSQEDVGNAIHLTKETVNRKLSGLQSIGVVELVGKRKLRVTNVAAMKDLVFM